jgi:hypothetical protein
MNPTKYDEDMTNALYDAQEIRMRNKAMEEERDRILKANIEEGKRRSKIANDAYNDLCDALGVKDLSASIDGGGSHLRIPIDKIATMVSRIEALKATASDAPVLTEGVL